MELWVWDRGAWNEHSIKMGAVHLELLVDATPGPAEDDGKHIYSLTASERNELIVLATVPVLFEWAAYVYFNTGSVIVEFSHRGSVTVWLRRDHHEGVQCIESWVAAGRRPEDSRVQ